MQIPQAPAGILLDSRVLGTGKDAINCDSALLLQLIRSGDA